MEGHHCEDVYSSTLASQHGYSYFDAYELYAIQGMPWLRKVEIVGMTEKCEPSEKSQDDIGNVKRYDLAEEGEV